jgi:hypothetical protein
MIRSALALAAAWLLLLIEPASAQSIWFAPQPRLGQNSDYMDLFQPNAPWQQVASSVNVFAVGGQFVVTAPDDVLRQIFDNVKRRRFVLHIGILPLTPPDGLYGPGGCGFHVEGYGGGPMPGFAQRLKALGAQPKFFGMDEPLYHGHVFRDGSRGCHSSIIDIARDVAGKFKAARQVFPGVRFGDVEPLTFRPGDPWFSDDRWLHDLSEWFDAYEAATGDKLAYFRLDLWWTMQWQPHMQALADLLKRKGIPLQVIYNASGKQPTDAAWSDSAAAHFKEFETGPWPKPDAAVFNYWTQPPIRVLPETDPTTVTGLVGRYLKWRQSQQR